MSTSDGDSYLVGENVFAQKFLPGDQLVEGLGLGDFGVIGILIEDCRSDY